MDGFLGENSNEAFSYLSLAGLVILITCLIYVYLYDKNIDTDGDIYSHDEDQWFINHYIDNNIIKLPTCIGYGTEGEKCNASEVYCTGGQDKRGHFYHGSLEKQINELKNLGNDGIHKACPLVFLGSD
jgi:hypothetical protein